jgi:hypothetical protein
MFNGTNLTGKHIKHALLQRQSLLGIIAQALPKKKSFGKK